MKAAVCTEPDTPIVIKEIAIDQAEMGRVMVKTSACAIYHGDIYCIRVV